MVRQKTTRIRRNFDILKALHKAKPTRRKEILRSADDDLVHCVCDCARNVLNGNVQLTPSRKRSLSRHVGILRKLADPRGKLSSKKRLVRAQKGGFLGALIPALLGPVIGALGGLITGR